MQVKQDYILAEDWMVFLLLFSLFIVGFLRFSFPRKSEQLTESMLHARIARQRIKDDQLFASNFSIFIFLNYLIMLSYFIFAVFKFFGGDAYNSYGNHLFWITVLGIALVYVVKSIVVKITDVLFDKNYGSGEYLYNVFLFNKGLGVFLLPLNIGLTLVSKQIAVVFIWVGIALAVTFLLIRIFRGLRIAIENNSRILYLILYLCALEVLPTTLIVKELAGNVN